MPIIDPLPPPPVLTPTSVYNDLLVGVAGLITSRSLNYTPEGTATPMPAVVSIRKLPRVGENLDVLPVICVCPDDKAERIESASAEDPSAVFKWYMVEVVTVYAGNQDFVSNLPAYLSWRQIMMRLFNGPVPFQIPATSFPAYLVDTNVIPEIPLDRRKVNDNYDYSGFAISFRCLEPRSDRPVPTSGGSITNPGP